MKKKTGIKYFLCAVAFYIAAAILFIEDDTSVGVAFLCIGSMWLCMAAAYNNKSKK